MRGKGKLMIDRQIHKIYKPGEKKTILHLKKGKEKSEKSIEKIIDMTPERKETPLI